jgi:hypothetical protein
MREFRMPMLTNAELDYLVMSRALDLLSQDQLQQVARFSLTRLQPDERAGFFKWTGVEFAEYSVGLLREHQVRITDDERKELWAEIQEGYCSACGRAVSADERCHCRNDE